MDTPALLNHGEDHPADRAQYQAEREMIDAARAQIEAGLYIEEADVAAWIDSIGTDRELPLPQPKH